MGHKGIGACKSAFWSLWSLGISTLLFSREFARSKSFAQIEHQHSTKRGHFSCPSVMAVSTQLWCWHSLIQPYWAATHLSSYRRLRSLVSAPTCHLPAVASLPCHRPAAAADWSRGRPGTADSKTSQYGNLTPQVPAGASTLS